MTIPRRTVHLLATGVLLLVLAYALPRPVGPAAGREATVLGAAASVWEDGDLLFGEEDRLRVERHWQGAPGGVALVVPEDPGAEPVYAVPFLYPTVAAPAYGVLGPKGLRVLDAALYLLIFWTAWRLLGHPLGCRRLPRSGLTLAAFFFASAALAHVLRLGPTVFEMACVFFALALWCRVRVRPLWGAREVLPTALAGLLAACAFASQPALGLFALPPAIDLLWSRRWKAAASFAAVALVAAFLGAEVQEDLTGPLDWSWGWGLPAAAQVYDGALPGQVGAEPRDPTAGPFAGPEERAAGAEAGAGPRNVLALLLGRHVGLVPYFPFALFALGLYLVDLRRPGGRSRHLVAAALLGYLGLVGASLADAALAPAAPGLAAVAAVYPLFLFLPCRLRAGGGVLIPFAAAGLWAVPALVSAIGPLDPAAVFELHARGAAFRPLPMETGLLTAGRLPGYAPFERPADAGLGRWLVPREAFFHDEPNPRGVWVKGASRAEVYVLSDGDAPEIRFRARSISAENVLTVEGDDGRVTVRFDTEAKRAGTPVTVRPEMLGRFDTDGDGEDETLSRFTLRSSEGTVPARVDAASNDVRYLGTFLELGIRN